MPNSSKLIFGMSGLALILSLPCLIIAGVLDAWHPLSALLCYAAGYCLALLALTSLLAGAIASSRRAPWIAGMLVVVAAVVIMHYASTSIAHASRERAVQIALDAGLENDCRNLYFKFQNDPKFQDDGFIRIFRESAEYDSLPSSIRMFNPGYVTIENHPFGGDMPPNVGLCKNGFGGFAFGVRVFIDDRDIPKPFWSKPITPKVYLWQQET